jgi:hypothetical protein
METIMKNIVITIATILFASTAYAEKQYTLTSTDSKVNCTGTDIAIGVGVGAISAVVIGVATVAASRVVGIAAPLGVVGIAGATSGAILTNSTLPAIGAASVLSAPVIGTAGFYASCVYNSVNK